MYILTNLGLQQTTLSNKEELYSLLMLNMADFTAN